LVEISKNIRDLTANFKIGAETSDNLKRTFKGLFALLDIGKQAFVAIAGGLASVIKYILPAGNGVLSFTGSIGDFIVMLDKSIKSSNAFGVAVQKIGNFMKPIADGVKKAVVTIINAFKEFGNVDTSGFDSFTERVGARFKPFTKIADFVEGVFSKIAGVVKKVAPIFYKLSEIIGNTVSKMQENIVKSLDNSEFNNIFDIVNGGLFAGILFGLKKFIDRNLTSPFE
jgi:phage-related protein